jgi:hypothetical protein
MDGARDAIEMAIANWDGVTAHPNVSGASSFGSEESSWATSTAISSLIFRFRRNP